MSGAPTLVSLFVGAGGLDLGLERAGFHLLAAVDSDEDCVETLLRNKKSQIPVPTCDGRTYLEGARLVAGGIEEVSPDELRPDDAPPSWSPDLLAGGPPCQPFSSSGKQLALTDPRGRLFEHFVRFAEVLRPRAILFENVRGLVTARGPSGEPGEAIALVRDSFESIGYATNFALLNCADFGLPQRRVRLFMLATRQEPLPAFPQPTHSAGGYDLVGSKPWSTLGEFLAGFPDPDPDEVVRPSPALEPLLRDVPGGSGLKSPGPRERTRPGGHWGYKQGTFVADPTKPARTVTAASTQDWVREPDGRLRRLTLRECAALQGFPPEWEFAGSKASQFRQVGNAVPTLMGDVLGRALVQALSRARPRSSPRSAPFPAEFLAAMEYTRKEEARNGESRRSARKLRSRREADESLFLGLGSAEGERSMLTIDETPRRG